MCGRMTQECSEHRLRNNGRPRKVLKTCNPQSLMLPVFDGRVRYIACLLNLESA